MDGCSSGKLRSSTTTLLTVRFSSCVASSSAGPSSAISVVSSRPFRYRNSLVSNARIFRFTLESPAILYLLSTTFVIRQAHNPLRQEVCLPSNWQRKGQKVARSPVRPKGHKSNFRGQIIDTYPPVGSVVGSESPYPWVTITLVRTLHG